MHLISKEGQGEGHGGSWGWRLLALAVHQVHQLWTKHRVHSSWHGAPEARAVGWPPTYACVCLCVHVCAPSLPSLAVQAWARGCPST